LKLIAENRAANPLTILLAYHLLSRAGGIALSIGEGALPGSPAAGTACCGENGTDVSVSEGLLRDNGSRKLVKPKSDMSSASPRRERLDR
jgi:hypothetical protein